MPLTFVVLTTDFMSRYFLALTLFLFSLSSLASTRYVIDELSINMRTGKGTDFTINEILKTGDAVTLLDDDGDGYSEVRTADGEVGYVLTRFLSAEPTGRLRAERMQSKVDDLQKKVTELQEALVLARSGVEAGDAKNVDLAKQNAKLQARLNWIEEASANSVKIADENQEMREKVVLMETEMATLKQENKDMKTWHQGQKVGAIILFVGLLIGWLLGRLGRPVSTSNSW